MNQDQEKIVGIRFRSEKDPTVVYCAPENQPEANDLGITVSDVIEATARYLVDREGFSTKSFIVSECKDEHKGLVCKVQFIDDGIVMARIQGILQ
jgi:hypothetical protein